MAYQHIKVPSSGQKITVNKDFSLNVPDEPIIPYIEGDGTGAEPRVGLDPAGLRVPPHLSDADPDLLSDKDFRGRDPADPVLGRGVPGLLVAILCHCLTPVRDRRLCSAQLHLRATLRSRSEDNYLTQKKLSNEFDSVTTDV